MGDLATGASKCSVPSAVPPHPSTPLSPYLFLFVPLHKVWPAQHTAANPQNIPSMPPQFQAVRTTAAGPQNNPPIPISETSCTIPRKTWKAFFKLAVPLLPHSLLPGANDASPGLCLIFLRNIKHNSETGGTRPSLTDLLLLGQAKPPCTHVASLRRSLFRGNPSPNRALTF